MCYYLRHCLCTQFVCNYLSEEYTVKKYKKRKCLYLLKKGQKGIIRALFSRLALFLVLFAVQAFILFSIPYQFKEIVPYFSIINSLFTVAMVLYLLNTTIEPTAKITWLVIIMLLPAFGALLFWYTQRDPQTRLERHRLNTLFKLTKGSIPQDPHIVEAISAQDKGVSALAHYIRQTGCHPIFNKTAVTYFSSGEEAWQAMLLQLAQARHFIFLEYFIIEEGLMWGSILEILAQKAKEGVDVRIMYDGACEFSKLPHDYPERLKTVGIACKIFGRLTPFLSMRYNYRDHRKILVIDGIVAFNGGINLADEYINAVQKYGHWKDAAIMLQGDAVQSFTLMFLQLWSVHEQEWDFTPYLKVPAHALPVSPDGFVIPYGDNPVDTRKTGECVYMDILNRAQRYVHIVSPYFVLDGQMEMVLKFAAERGVEIKLMLPGIPDKKIPYALAKTHYASLLASGVRIYEYTPGFVHSKIFVCDDREAVVGTINLDYRSLYYHFECATYMYGTSCIKDIETDYQSTLTECREVTSETVQHEKWMIKGCGIVLKPLAPLM